MQKLFYLILIPLFLLGLQGCKKDVEGCTDDTSKNFNPDATVNNGSCTYEGSVVFWYNEATAIALIADASTSITVTVNGNVIGSSATSVFWTQEPDCLANGVMVKVMNLGKEMSKSYTYSVKDQTGFEYWSGNVSFIANTCNAIELDW